MASAFLHTASQLPLIKKPVLLWKKLFVNSADVSWCVVYWQLWLKQVTLQLEKKEEKTLMATFASMQSWAPPPAWQQCMWGFQFARALLESYLLGPVDFLMDNLSYSLLMATLVFPIPTALERSPMPQSVSAHPCQAPVHGCPHQHQQKSIRKGSAPVQLKTHPSIHPSIPHLG